MVQFDVKRVQSGNESFMVSFDFNKTPVTQIADYIIIAASKHGTSDIHFDPRDEGMMVRFRIDGDCQDYTFVPKSYEKNLTTRLKLLANMNITESRLPQDGAIKGEFGGQYLDMRVSALPLNTGEKIVIRILDYTRSLQGIDSLGFHPKNLEKIKRMMGLPNGIILTTGATGSGKSTTTYSILQGLNKTETNVITVEDPIEMNIEGINQVQVNADIGMTFAAALRSILRQDPNVILIGEIRDSETAQIAVRASITGHLVLSTIHTNNALATVERLLDMNVERYLLSTALSGIISQRLAKMLCPECKIKRATTKYEKKVFRKYMKMEVNEVWDANPKGCEECRRGYHGRIAVHEVLELNDELKIAISDEKMDKSELAKKVYSGNTITMLQDALIKCLEGKTSFGEVYKTIEIENEDDDNYENEIENEIKEAITVNEEPKVSDDLLETVVQEGHSEVFVPTVITAAAFSDKNDSAEGEQQEGNTNETTDANVEQQAQETATDVQTTTEDVQVIIPTVQTTETQSVTSSVQPVDTQTVTAEASNEPTLAETPITPNVIMPSVQEITPSISSPAVETLPENSSNTTISYPTNVETLENVITTPIEKLSEDNPSDIMSNTMNIALPVTQELTTTSIEKLSEDNPSDIMSNTMNIALPVTQNVTASQVENLSEGNLTGVTSNPMDIKTLPSVQTGAVSIVNNTSTSGLPISAALGQMSVPLVDTQQIQTPLVSTVATVPNVQTTEISTVPPVSTLPEKNDTIIEAMTTNSVTNITPKQNTYINIVPGTTNENDGNVLFDTKNETLSLPNILPSAITPGSSIEAKDFLVQKPLMPSLPPKK